MHKDEVQSMMHSSISINPIKIYTFIYNIFRHTPHDLKNEF